MSRKSAGIVSLRRAAASRRRVAIMPRSPTTRRSEEHTSELQSLMRISYAVFCLKKKKKYMKTSRTLSNTTSTNLTNRNIQTVQLYTQQQHLLRTNYTSTNNKLEH